MTTLATAPAPASLDEILLFGSAVGTPGVVSTPSLITAMLDSGKGISDLIFSPGRPLQVERHGELTSVPVPQLPVLQPEDTARIARDLIDGNEQALLALKDQGSCDLSYSLPHRSRFRVNVFRQRGTYAVVMRVIATKIPTLAELNLPPRSEERRVGKSVDLGGRRINKKKRSKDYT